MNPPRRSAFTLIELLVVITIIALLIAILLPALRSARTAAQMAVAVSNARQIQLALHMYANDNDGSIPYLYTDDGSSFSGYWGGNLMRGEYISDIDVFWSPGRDNSMLDLDGAAEDWDNHNWRYVGYGLNRGASTVQDGDNVPAELPLHLGTSAISSPSEFVSLVDFWISPSNDGAVDSTSRFTAGFVLSDGAIEASVSGGRFNLFTYNGGVARSYFDGHASGGDSRALGWKANDQYHGWWQYINYSFQQTKPWFTNWFGN